MNISLLRRTVDYLILPFLSVGQSNYSRLIIFLRQLLSNAADEGLQKAVLATSIINSKGKPSKAITSNEQLELYNLDNSEDIATYSNSTHNLAQTFKKKALYRKATR